MKKILALVILCVLCFNHANYSQKMWEKMNYSIPSAVEEFATNSNNEIFLGSVSNGLYKSVDEGLTWTSVGDNYGFKYVSALAISPTSNTIVIGQGFGVLRSTNNGESWDSTGANLFMNLTCSEKGDFYAGTPVDGVIRSTDNGLTWEHIYNGLTQFSIYSITFGDNSDIYCSSYGQAVYYSSDSGDHWIPIPINTYVNNVNSLGYYSGILYAGTGSGFYRSQDKGTTWESINITSNNLAVRIIKINQYGHIYAVTLGNGIYRSTDGGNSWIEINSGLSEFNITAITMSPEGYIYLGTDSGSVYRSVNVMTAINTDKPSIPSTIKLEQNYPNPFNPTTTIQYVIPSGAKESQEIASSQQYVTRNDNVQVALRVYDVLGREVSTLVNDIRQPGIFKVNFNGSGLPSGIYFYKIQVGNNSIIKKMQLLK